MAISRLISSIVVVAVISCAARANAESTVVAVAGEDCSAGVRNQPNGPFGVMVFCEDALGTHIGVIYVDNLAAPVDGTWKLWDRFWQRSDWAADVTAFAWEPSGRLLFVSTSAIYGTGAVYRLDLRGRRYAKLFPLPAHTALLAKIKGGICVTELVGVDAKKKRVTVKAGDCGTTFVEIELAY